MKKYNKHEEHMESHGYISVNKQQNRYSDA